MPQTIASGIDDLKPSIDSALEAASEFGEGCPAELAAAMRYALLAPGKRLRPALVLMAAQACQRPRSTEKSPNLRPEMDARLRDAVMPGAVAVEMIHAYSLIHDDLPAMDDDDLRRGRPTVHIKFDEATAILAGDALQAEAFAHLARYVADPVKAVTAIGVLARASSAIGLVGGQADDLAAEKLDFGSSLDSSTHHSGFPDHAGIITADSGRWFTHLESIHRRKTGALIAASLDLGAILGGSDDFDRRTLASYADDLGLAFQVVDDVLDHTADDAALGKRVGKDAGRGKLTYPGLLGLEAAQSKAKELVASAKQKTLVFGSAGWRLACLADYVLERKH